jgi:hypothetical protein
VIGQTHEKRFCRTCGAALLLVVRLCVPNIYRKQCSCASVRYSKPSVRAKHKNYIHRVNERTKANSVCHGFFYTDEDNNFIVDNLLKMTFEEIALHLGRTRYAINRHIHRLRELGVIKPPLYNMGVTSRTLADGGANRG